MAEEQELEDDLEGLDEPGESVSPDEAPPEEEPSNELEGDDDEITLEDIDEAEEGESEESDEKDKEKKKKPPKTPEEQQKLMIILIGVIGALIIILGGVAVYMMLAPEEEDPDKAKKITKKIKKLEAPQIEPDQVDKMLKRANFLYKKGEVKEALKIFDEVSEFSNSISMYNLGVSQMKQEDYKAALESFKTSIKNQSNRCVSAINAGVCALHLGDRKLFKYYIDLASGYLHTTTDSKMYDYYYALINYYKQLYPESIAALSQMSVEPYDSIRTHLSANIYLNLGDEQSAINALEQNTTDDDLLPLGLLYARVGEYKSAIKYLQRSLDRGVDPLRSQLALGLVYLKIGQMQAAYKFIKDAHSIDEAQAPHIYPIKVVLKESLFNINDAQKSFSETMHMDYKSVADILYYFAPYRLTNLNKTISYIRKGNKNSYIDQIDNAQAVYKKGSYIASINEKMSKGIKKSLEFKIRDANAIFAELVKDYPNYSYLQYNLGLSYAQLGLYDKAYTHFAKSYNLDNNNQLSAIFMFLSAKLSNQNVRKLGERLSTELSGSLNMDKPQDAFYRVLYGYLLGGNTISAAEWMDENRYHTPLSRAFETIIAAEIDRVDIQKEKSKKLMDLTDDGVEGKDDVIASILHFYANNRNLTQKQFAAKAQQFLRNNNLDFESLYYGPKSVKEIYIKLAQVAGMLYDVRDTLRERVLTERYDTRGVLQALAYTDIYLNFFEEAYTIYNKLIDELNEADSYTLFLGATSAIGAGHHAQAIILLELANLEDKLNYESRYALGLLYHEVFNLEAAQIQYAKINLKDFESNYFDYQLIRPKETVATVATQ
jgi:predicted Zn-dependent protease